MIKINKVGKDIFTLSLGAFVAHLVPFLSSFILARIYTAEQFGDKGVFLSAAAILGVLSTGQYEMSIVRPLKERDAESLIQLCFVIVSSFSFLLLSVIFIMDFAGIDFIEKFPCKYLLPLYVFVIGISQIYMHYANRKEDYRSIASSGAVRNIVQDSSRILFGIFNSAYGLIHGTIVGMFSSILYNERRLSVFKIFAGHYDWHNMKRLAFRYRYFLMYLLPSSLLNNLSSNLPVVLLPFFFTKEYVGYFSMTLSLLLLPVQLIGTSIGKVFYKKSSVETDKGIIRKLASNLFFVLFSIGMAINIILIPFGENLFSFVLGENWGISGIYAGIMAPWILLTLVFSPLSVIFDSKDRQNIELYMNLVLFVARIIVVLIGGMVFNDMSVTVMLYGITGILIWVIEGFFIIKLTGISFGIKGSILFVLSIFIILFFWLFEYGYIFKELIL